MGCITFDWYDADKTLVYLHYGKGWTHQDVFHAYAATFETLESVNHAVDLLLDITAQDIPPNVISLAPVLKHKISANQRHTYIVGANTFIRILVRAAAVALPVFERVTFCQTVDEALKRLQQDRDALAAHAAHGSVRHELD